GVAAADVDPVFSEVEIVAEERRCADLALAAQEVRAAQRELVGPESPPDAAAPRLEAAGGSVEGVRRHEVRVGEPRADHEGLDEEVAESGPVDGDPRVRGVQRNVGPRQTEGEGQVRTVPRPEREGRTDDVRDDVDVQPPGRDAGAVAVPQRIRIEEDDSVEEVEPRFGLYTGVDA